jgi:membrane protease subunit (stomatin/prohibitin family)
VELGASGEFNIRVINSRQLLLRLVGTTKGMSQSQLMGEGGNRGFFRSLVMTQVKSYLAATIKECGINVLEIDERLMELSEALREKLNVGLGEYGLEMPEFFVSRIVTPDDDPNFRKMKEQYAEQYLLVRQEQIRKLEAEAAAERKAVEARTAAQMKIIEAQGSAEAYRLQAEAEAAEMKMKGYSYQQETARQVGLEAMKNGLTGNGGAGSGLGEVAGLGVTLGAMGSVIGMTRDALNPTLETAGQIGKQVGTTISDTWDCGCGQKGISTKFCPECGAKRPEPETTWDCACGKKGITSKFCPECGAKRPEPETTWDCSCGAKGITSKFCPECGAKRPEATWDCSCGQKGITGKFCPECGSKRGE